MADFFLVILLIASFFVSVLAVPALIQPRWLRLSHRIYSLPMATAMLGWFGVFAMVSPMKPRDSGTVVAGLILLGVWGGLIAFAKFVAFYTSPIRQRYRGFVRARRHRLLAMQKQMALATNSNNKDFEKKAEKPRESRKIRQNEPYFSVSGPVSTREPSYISGGAGDRLSAAYDDLGGDFSDLSSYRAAINREEDNLNTARDVLRDLRGVMTREDYENERDLLAEDHEEIRWRKRWLADQSHRESISRPGFAASGKWARFEYVDADGVVTDRHVVNWERRGGYIVGYDKMRSDTRTFRQDRISEWQAG